MPDGEVMPKTLYVAGTRRGVGKTRVSRFLLSSLSGAAAVKLTCCRGGTSCPRERPCGVCAALDAPFAVISDPEIIAHPGKDTALLAEVCGGSVVWLQAREQALREGLEAALLALRDHPVVVVEGNAAFQATEPDLGILVIGPGPDPPKATVAVALKAVRGVVLNLRPGCPPPVLIEGLREHARIFSFDAAQPHTGQEAQSFIAWVKEELGVQHA